MQGSTHRRGDDLRDFTDFPIVLSICQEIANDASEARSFAVFNKLPSIVNIINHGPPPPYVLVHEMLGRFLIY